MTKLHWLVDAYFTIGMFANFVLFVVQAIKLFRVKDSKGLSFITFVGFNLIQLSTILYGIFNADKLLAIGYLFSFLACGSISIMIPIYRRKEA